MITLRPMKESDDKIASQIISECYQFIAGPDNLTIQQCDRMIEDRCQPGHISIMRERHECTIAEVNGIVVGIIAVEGSNIEELFVHPGHHRQGIGSALFRNTESSAATAGHTKLTVGTTGYGSPFYKAMGMHTVGRQQITLGPLEGRDLVLLKKELTNTKQKKLVSISGVMGSGKTALCAQLFRRIEGCVFLDADSLWSMNPCDLTGVNQTMVVNNITHVIRNYITHPTLKVILFAWPAHLGYISEAVLDGLRDLNYAVCKIALTCTEEVQQERMEKQGRSEFDIDLSLERLGISFPDDTTMIDTSNMTLSDVCDQLLSFIVEKMAQPLAGGDTMDRVP